MFFCVSFAVDTCISLTEMADLKPTKPGEEYPEETIPDVDGSLDKGILCGIMDRVRELQRK